MTGEGEGNKSRYVQYTAAIHGIVYVQRVFECGAAVGPNHEAERVCEIRITKQSRQACDMICKHEVTIRQVTHDFSARFCQGAMTIRLTSAHILGVIEEAHPAVLADKIRNDFARLFRYAISDDEDLQILDRLGEDAAD
jgi:hypothetical protein